MKIMFPNNSILILPVKRRLPQEQYQHEDRIGSSRFSFLLWRHQFNNTQINSLINKCRQKLRGFT
jgi:hypothetical protein